MKKEVAATINEWIMSRLGQVVERACVFGSLSRLSDETPYLPGRSDIDLLLILSEDQESILDRQRCVLRIARAKPSLELSLIPVTKWAHADIPGVSIHVMTQKEAELGIHKSGIPDFFAANRFFDIRKQDEWVYPRLDVTDSMRAAGCDMFEFADVIRKCQSFRGRLCGLSAHGGDLGELGLGSERFGISKDLARSAARVRHAARWQELDPIQRWDTWQGSHYIVELLQTKADSFGEEVPEVFEELRQRVLLATNGYSSGLGIEDVTLLWELIASVSSLEMLAVRENVLCPGKFVSTIGSGDIFLLVGSAALPIESVDGLSVFDEVEDSEIASMDKAPRDGFFLREKSFNTVYVTIAGARMAFSDPDELREFGGTQRDVLVLPDGALKSVPRVPAHGTVLRERTSTKMFIVDGNRIQPCVGTIAGQPLVVPNDSLRLLPGWSSG